MRRLLDFLIKHNHWFVFVLLETLCMLMLFNSNGYQSFQHDICTFINATLFAHTNKNMKLRMACW